jgi:serine/threonine-protein kinase RsbW
MSSVVPSAPAGSRPLVERAWPPAPLSPGRARRLLAYHLIAWGLPGLVDTAGLVVSELVTNAIIHGCPDGHVLRTRFERLERGVRIEVHDADRRKPERGQASADAESGRGLDLVDALTGPALPVRGRRPSA